MKKFLALMMVVSMGVAACGDGNGGGGGGGGGGGSEIDNDQAEAQASALAEQAANTFEDLAGDPDSGVVIAELFTVYGNALGVASAQNNAGLSTGDDASANAVATPSDTNVVTCAIETANSVSWDNCVYNGYTIDGSISKSGDTLDIDLVITFASVAISFEGSLTVTTTLIDGQFSVTSTVQSVGFTLDVDFDEVVLTDGCPTSGSIFIDPTVSAGQIRSVRVDFGPACGDVALFEE